MNAIEYAKKLRNENLGCREAKIEINGNTIRFDINFENESIDNAILASIANFVENISNYDLQNLIYIKNSISNSDDKTVKDYVAFHIEELGDEFLEQIGISNDLEDVETEFLNKMRLARVGIYSSEQKESVYYSVFDYSIGKDLSDQLIVVKISSIGELINLSWES